MEHNLRISRDKTSLENTPENNKEFQSLREKYNNLLNQYGIFTTYYNIVNKITENNNQVKLLQSENFNLRMEANNLIKDISNINSRKDKTDENKGVLNEKIKEYLNINQKINENNRIIKEVKNSHVHTFVMLEPPKVKTNKVIKKKKLKIVKSKQKIDEEEGKGKKIELAEEVKQKQKQAEENEVKEEIIKNTALNLMIK